MQIKIKVTGSERDGNFKISELADVFRLFATCIESQSEKTLEQFSPYPLRHSFSTKKNRHVSIVMKVKRKGEL